MSPAQLAALPPLATEAPPSFVQTEQHKRKLGERGTPASAVEMRA